MSVPRFSVIIPTRDRNDLLALCLECLAPGTQTFASERYEVIVTDDSPTQAAQNFIATRFPWAKWVAGPRRGPASNRNNGAASARGEFLVFIDDDCLPELDLLAAYDAVIRPEIDTYEGRITCREGPPSPRETSPINLHGGVLWSCNFVISRNAFDDVRGFDERFPLPHMEDTDMRDRILAAGHRIEFVPSASVDHPPRRLAWGMRLARIHQAGVLYMVIHPPVRGLLWYLQNQFRARVSVVVHSRKSIDSFTALASVPFELLAIALRWRRWMQWANVTARTPRTESSLPRVLMLHTTLPESGRKPGGVEVAVHRLSNALVDLGVPVTVASLTPAPADARYVHRHLFPRSRWLSDSRFGRLIVLPALLNVIRLSDADVVHYHGDDWFVFRRPLATVRTLHGSALREAQRATRLPRRLVQYALFPLEKLAAKLATVGVGVGADAAALHGLRRVIGNGVDATLFTPGPKSPVPELLYVGTWEGRKRGRWMYETFVSNIATRHPNVVLRFISDEAPPPHPRVRYERFPSDVELARAYREAWIFVLPSTYEGFGIPYLEAMASGTAVVASPNTGASELLDNGRYGMLVSDDAFADSVLRLLDDAPARERLVAAGLERARAYLWSAVARAYLSVYRETLALRAAAGGS